MCNTAASLLDRLDTLASRVQENIQTRDDREAESIQRDQATLIKELQAHLRECDICKNGGNKNV